MSTWRRSLDIAVDEFVSELVRRGFKPENETGALHGFIRVPVAGGLEADKSFTIIVSDDFPFSPPAVCFRHAPAKPTWHVNTSGVICLYRPGTVTGKPWATVDGLFDRVREWHDAQLHGWPNDPGDPDLSRFFTPLPAGGRGAITMVSYTDLDELIGRDLQMVRGDSTRAAWQRLVPGPPLNRKDRRRQERWVYAADLGELAEPVWNWKSILDRLEKNDVDAIARRMAHARGSHGILVLRYSRPDETGTQRVAAIALRIEQIRDSVKINAIEIGEETSAAMSARAGAEFSMLKRQLIGIVGCGAIGGFVADQLARAGVRRFHLVDGDILRPGNCVRHVADSRHVAKPKVEAVRDILVERHGLLASDICVHATVLTPDLAFALLGECDLVIDATADVPAHELLEHIAAGGGREIVVAGLYRDGGVCQVRRRGDGHTDPLPTIPSLNRVKPTAYRELGCGDPVSPSSPVSVSAAAALASQMAIDTLRPSRRRGLPDVMTAIYDAQPDEPFRSVGVL